MPASFDPSVLSQIPDYGPQPAQAAARGLNLASAAQGYQAGVVELEEKKREQSDREKIQKLLQGADLSSFEGRTKAAQEITKINPKLGMSFMGEVQTQRQQEQQLSLEQLQFFEKQTDAVSSAIDPVVAMLDKMKEQGAKPAELRAAALSASVGPAQDLAKNYPQLKPVVDRFLQGLQTAPDPYAFVKSQDEMSNKGSAAVKDRIAQMNAETARRREEAYERAQGVGGGAGGDQGRVSAVRAAMSERGVSFPSGMRSKQAQDQTIRGLLARHPNESADQIADRVRSGALGFKTASTEAAVVSRREGQAAAAINALNREGGLYDQVLEVGRNVDMGSSKVENAFRLWKQGQAIADPDLSEYVNTLVDTRAEFASVLARGGQVTDSVRIASEHAFPDRMSYEELQRNVARSKEIARAIQAGNTAVIDAIVAGKSLDDALRQSSATSGGEKSAKATPPARPASIQAGERAAYNPQTKEWRVFRNGSWVAP